MIRRSVRKNFHSINYIGSAPPRHDPCIVVPNHHGWHDGYLMFLLLKKLNLNFVDWVAEYDAFPLFGRVGGLPFPADDPGRRAATIRRTLRLMKAGDTNLLLFAEGILHRPPEILAFGRSLEVVAKQVPRAKVIPVAIRYELSLHERPDAYIYVGTPVEAGDELAARTRLAVKLLLDELSVKIKFHAEEFQTLHAGTPDVNERWDMRRLKL